jgi:DNA modification methylase
MTKAKNPKVVKKIVPTDSLVKPTLKPKRESLGTKLSKKAEKTETPPKARKVLTAFNGLSPREWTMLSRNIWDDVSSPRNKRHLEHGAVYPVKLAERAIAMYSGEDDLVFDPFNGIGSTIVAASRMNRRGIGIELNPRFVELTKEWLAEEKTLFSSHAKEVEVVNDDCRNMEKYLEANSVQLTVTSPPYANFIQRSVKDRATTHKTSLIVKDNNSRVKAYSDHKDDFGNLDYDQFLVDSQDLFKSLLKITKPNGYAVWVVKDYRLPPKRPYISMHSDLALAAQNAGWLWHDLIIWNQNEQRRLVLLGYPTRFYTNQNCSFLVVLRKDA